MYSATRQWNPGDEFILAGSIELLKSVIGEHNVILYNRHPDIHPLCGEGRFRRVRENWKYPELNELEKDMKIGFFDNSVKFDSDLNYVDFAVVAGSPECFNKRCENFFQHIIKNNIPMLAIGVGYADPYTPEWINSIYRKSLLVTARAESVTEALKKNNHISAQFRPCPALFCIPVGQEKKITDVKKIGLVFVVSDKDSVSCQYVKEDTYNFVLELYHNILQNIDSCQIEIICHYIDEIAVAYREFGRYGVNIRYSYSSEKYADIYSEFDCVLSPRVHGCGISSSLGIPNIHITHDKLRSSTVLGFKSRLLTTDTEISNAVGLLENVICHAAVESQQLIQYKQRTFAEYSEIIKKNIAHSPDYSDIDCSAFSVSTPPVRTQEEMRAMVRQAEDEYSGGNVICDGAKQSIISSAENFIKKCFRRVFYV